MEKFFLNKIFQRVAYENIKIKDGIDMEVYENLDFVNYDWHVPWDPTTLKNSPKGLLKSLLVEISGILPRKFFARNFDMMLVPTMGLYWASTTVPLKEQGMVVEGERIRIALEERFTSINHSFDGSILGETSSEGRVSFWCPKYFEVLP